MDLLSTLGDVLIILLIALVIYAAAAIAMILAAYRLAAAQEEIPRSLDCRDSRHAACVGCSCRCHP